MLNFCHNFRRQTRHSVSIDTKSNETPNAHTICLHMLDAESNMLVFLVTLVTRISYRMMVPVTKVYFLKVHRLGTLVLGERIYFLTDPQLNVP